MKKVAIIGGGAAGMTCALALSKQFQVTVYERNDRLGKKLSATGNGQGNVTNVNMDGSHYFSDDAKKVEGVLSRYSYGDVVAFLEGLGGLFLPDARGRVYPASKQASAVTDLLRGAMSVRGVTVKFQSKVTALSHRDKFQIKGEDFCDTADYVVLCAGGMAAPNFGTDGSAYALAKCFGHRVTECTPSLVQLRCNPADVRGLKGIRTDTQVTVYTNGKEKYSVRGDVLFTESGVSGDAIFRASAYTVSGDTLKLDFLPDVPVSKVQEALTRGCGELLCIVNNGLGRVIARRSGELNVPVPMLVKQFPLTVTGTLGFAYAQVTKGGIPLAEVDEHLMSKYQRGLFFAGEMLNVDGECGGYNLQWAFASALVASEGVAKC